MTSVCASPPLPRRYTAAFALLSDCQTSDTPLPSHAHPTDSLPLHIVSVDISQDTNPQLNRGNEQKFCVRARKTSVTVTSSEVSLSVTNPIEEAATGITVAPWAMGAAVGAAGVAMYMA